jgi:hypothetical protein
MSGDIPPYALMTCTGTLPSSIAVPADNTGVIVDFKVYRAVIVPVVLHGCETWSPTSREECRLRVFENRVLSRMFGPKRNVVIGE